MGIPQSSNSATGVHVANAIYMENTLFNVLQLFSMLSECEWSDYILELELWTILAQLALQHKNYELVRAWHQPGSFNPLHSHSIRLPRALLKPCSCTVRTAHTVSP